MDTENNKDAAEALDVRDGSASVLHDYYDWKLLTNGVCLHKGRAVEWYKDQITGSPWLPRKRRTFVSLVKGMERDGDILYLPNTPVTDAEPSTPASTRAQSPRSV